jgi:hypothetical protein
LKALAPEVGQTVADEMAAKGVQGTKEEMEKAFQTRFKKLVRFVVRRRRIKCSHAALRPTVDEGKAHRTLP